MQAESFGRQNQAGPWKLGWLGPSPHPAARELKMGGGSTLQGAHEGQDKEGQIHSMSGWLTASGSSCLLHPQDHRGLTLSLQGLVQNLWGAPLCRRRQ